MNRSLCLVSLVSLVMALTLASEAGQASDASTPAAEQQPRRDSTAKETFWYVDLDEARREARRADKPLMMVFR